MRQADACELCPYPSRCHDGCARGANGTRCDVCVEGFYAFGGSCRACPADGRPPAGLFAMVGVVLVAGTSHVFSRNSRLLMLLLRPQVSQYGDASVCGGWVC